MYKRIPNTCINSNIDVYNEVVQFLADCAFVSVYCDVSVLLPNFLGVMCSVFKDKLSNHYICIFARENLGVYITILDNYDSSKVLYEQLNVPFKGSRIGNASHSIFCCGYSYSIYDDLICLYNNGMLMFILTPTKCNIYNKWGAYSTSITKIFGVGRFTKYMVDYEDCIFIFSNGEYHTVSLIQPFDPDTGEPSGEPFYSVTYEYIAPDYKRTINGEYTPPSFPNVGVFMHLYVCVFCNPEARYTLFDKHWYVCDLYYKIQSDYDKDVWTYGNVDKFAITSFDTPLHNFYPRDNYPPPSKEYKKIELPRFDIDCGSFSKYKRTIANTLNNSSILLPLVVYVLREPMILNTWSAIGENRLINLIDMSHIGLGDIYIDTDDNNYHKYFIVDFNSSDGVNAPADFAYYEFDHDFLGLAIEIEAKEKLLHSQSQDYLTINLEDSFRNFDRIEIIYEGNNEVEWTYDDLVAVFDTDGIFNLTKDENNKCMVYGLKNEDGESREYRFTCSESCEIISITGYRE